jgi:secreted PhoX family phosphatase
MSHHPDESSNHSENEHFQSVLSRSMVDPGRRALLRGGFGLAALSNLSILAGLLQSESAVADARLALGFNSVDKSLLDQVILPPGYSYKILHATGDRLTSALPAFSNTGAEADDWSNRIGDHHDGMDIFYINASGKFSATDTGTAVLAVNHESSADAHFFHPKGQTSGGVAGDKFDQFSSRGQSWNLGERPESEVIKEINHHGVSIVELTKSGATWGYKLDSSFNRRVNPNTTVNITGPAAHLPAIRSFMVTKWDPTGAKSRGTLNNCGHGKTPWGTYLTCEENWAFYFAMPKGSTPVDARAITSRARYGVASTPLAQSATTSTTQGWHTVTPANRADADKFSRWNISAIGATAADDFRNEPNTFGFVVEIDPLNAKSVPAKRVALGRFAHEAAVCGTVKVGSPLAFYMGCDSRNEYIYKFVSNANWDGADVGGGMSAGDKYLNEGKLYAAKFNDDGSGNWLELNISNPAIAGFAGYTFANQADVLVNARLAADAMGATKMDRPEWGALNNRTGEIYFALTNNNAANRTPATVNAANPRAYVDPDGMKGSGNPNGHIIRFKETDSTSTLTSTSFGWDIFLFGSEEDHPADVNLSGLTAKNSFSSPDGLWFSKATGICWIETDDGAFTDETNCMLLAAVPGTVGDGKKLTVTNTMTVGGAPVTATKETFIGAALGEVNLRRFLVAPRGSEVTGLTETPDGKTLFVNIQHPGELTPKLGNATTFAYQSQWPGVDPAYGPAGRPRSATIVITKDDGGVIGL